MILFCEDCNFILVYFSLIINILWNEELAIQMLWQKSMLFPTLKQCLSQVYLFTSISLLKSQNLF